MVNKLIRAGCASIFGIILGCSPPADDHGHEHEPTTAQITVWTDRYEVFAEHLAPVAGRPTTFITHVTDLVSLAPRRQGMVKFVLKKGASVVEHPQAAPARDGIYLPGITFPEAGDWQLTLLIPTDGTNAAVELGTVTVHGDEHSAEHAEIPEAPAGVIFLKEQQWNILSRAEPVTRRSLVERIRLPAITRAKPGHSASIVAPVAGQLLTPSGGEWPSPGDEVEAGELLALLRPSFSETAVRFAENEGEFGRAKAALEAAAVLVERTKILADRKAKSERELQEAELAWKTAKAGFDAAASMRAMYRQSSGQTGSPGITEMGGVPTLELRAPISGVIDQWNAGPGEPVAAESVVFQILASEVVWIEAHVPEAMLRRIPNDADASLPPAPGGGWKSIQNSSGRRVFTGLRVDPQTRTVPIVYELSNSDGSMLIGQALTLHVETSRIENAVAIPDSAIVEEAGNKVAFVQVSGETFEKRDLRIGIRDGNWIEVLSGVVEGERVVTQGAVAIRLASVSGVIPAHGHAH
jgi:membrane fusion protein, heavy metal efflux system